MKALITGASSGIGREFAKILSDNKYDLIVVSRNKKELLNLKKELSTDVEVVNMDLSSNDNCYKLYDMFKEEAIDIVINNAGFGIFGDFFNTSLTKELELINLNIEAVHILTKLFYKKFKKENKGYILNVASSAAFQPGPLMATYYASKSYVYNLTSAIAEEIRRENSKVRISVLCPGPVATNFNNVAGVEFGIKPLSSQYVAKYALKKLFKNKTVIIPGLTIKLAYIFGRLVPRKLLLKITYNIQRKKVIK